MRTSSDVEGLDQCAQRWQAGTSRFITPEDRFDPTGWSVAAIPDATARAFVLEHHYSAAYPAAIHRYGLMHTAGLLGGVAVFGAPMSTKVLTNPFPDLQPFTQSVELSRFVLLDEIGFNAETWFLARARRLLRAEGVRAVVSFSDPVPRVSDGRTVFRGHIGQIYAASNATYLGRGTPRTLTLINGVAISDRSLQKVRSGEKGAQYVIDRLVAAGARPMRATDTGATWLATALHEVHATKVRHAGNHRYAFADRGVTLGLDAQPRPTQVDQPPI